MDLIMDIAQINFPINDNDGDKLMAPLLIQKELCAEFGGCTAYDGAGSWVSDDGKLYAEPVKIIQTAFKNNYKNRLFLKNLVKKYGKLSKQEAVYLSINNKADIINIK